jgi:outer membrane protein TolC
MKYWYVLLLFLAPSGLAADQQPDRGVLSLSLKRAVQMAISPEGNEQIQISSEALKQAEARSAQARAALLPDISSSLGYRN